MVINGQFPGPLIEANEGDTIVVNVQNDMSTGTGIRKHSCHFSIIICILMLLSILNRLA
jgi:FtsP/CotA-like multicopper oxidase with cupredoxin domain